MRISDWSSDVCSSDLRSTRRRDAPADFEIGVEVETVPAPSHRLHDSIETCIPDVLDGGFRQTPIALRLLCAFGNCRQYCVGTTNQFVDADFNYLVLCAAHFSLHFWLGTP